MFGVKGLMQGVGSKGAFTTLADWGGGGGAILDSSMLVRDWTGQAFKSVQAIIPHGSFRRVNILENNTYYNHMFNVLKRKK